MKTKAALIIGVVIALACAGWAVSKRTSPDASLGVDSTTAAATATDPQLAALQTSPQARAFRERQDFEARANRFLRYAPKLGAVERSEQARALTASIDRYELDGGLSAGEALLLRSGLIKATVTNEAQQAAQIAELMERYRARADQRSAEYLAQHQGDPEFQDYKTRERAVVAEVMALREIPGGLSRDEYLRQRLQQERERAYR